MNKEQILDWVEYVGKLVSWASGAVRNFPIKEEKTKAGREKSNSPQSKFDGE